VKILITGAAGALGRDLVVAFGGHDVVAASHEHLDVSDRDAVLQAVGQTRPDAVVHAGAWTNVDGCELDPDRAFKVNALGTRYVAEAARWAGAAVCYVSTDYVFDGRASHPYTEWDTTNPVSAYGRSKLGGEHALQPHDTIVRTSWVCGRHGRNFVKTILERATDGQALTVVDDQHGCPSFTEDLASMIRRLVVERRPGLFHVTNQGATTWFRLAREVVGLAGLDPEQVQPVSTADLHPPRPAPRPAFSVLDNAALRLGGLPLLDDYHEPLARLVKELLAE
jgi:dTDP-4-dehydrorhamnose reductase